MVFVWFPVVCVASCILPSAAANYQAMKIMFESIYLKEAWPQR